MLILPFVVSKSTRDKLMACMAGLDYAQSSQILAAMADLCAEVEVYCTQKAMESLRQQWANSLATMLRS